MFEGHFQDCYVRLTGATLTVGNDLLERAWDMSQELPLAGTLTDKATGKAWLTEEPSQWEAWPDKRYTFYKAGITEGTMRVTDVRCEEDDDYGIAQKHLLVTVRMAFDAFDVEWIHILYPGLPVHRTFLRATVRGEQTVENRYRAEEWPDDYLDWLPLSALHSRWECVKFADHTDDMENLVHVDRGLFSRREMTPHQGNLLIAEDYLAQDGLVMVKEGPVPLSYLPGMNRDFYVRGLRVFPSCWGFEVEECRKRGTLTSYGSTVILWHGGKENAYRALHDYLRAQRIYVPRRDAQVMTNSWGDGSADGHLNERFLLAELARARELGVDFYQIDDGWQLGTTANSVNAATDENTAWGEGYYKSNPKFWSVNPVRLPNGLEPVVECAREGNVALGIWFSPDSMNDFEHWQEDSELLLDLYRKYNIRAFKMDGLIFRNKLCEENFGRMMERVVEGSKGEVFFNLDTTASVRNGYLGRCQYGSLFLENRFTGPFGRWPNYWPHYTLRNLWVLSRYLPTERLQIEVLNVKQHAELYGDDPLAPAACGQAYAFAATLFANPLFWMELTGLDEDAVETLRPMIKAYKQVQADILGGFVQPIGEEPDGTRWTGFQSMVDEKSGYVHIIRENNGEDSFAYRLHGIKNARLKLESVLGDGSQDTVSVNEKGEAVFTLNKPLSFALYRYTSESK